MLKPSWWQPGIAGAHVPAVLGGNTLIMPKIWTTLVVDIVVFFLPVVGVSEHLQDKM